jgi:hypothetical protein
MIKYSSRANEAKSAYGHHSGFMPLEMIWDRRLCPQIMRVAVPARGIKQMPMFVLWEYGSGRI